MEAEAFAGLQQGGGGAGGAVGGGAAKAGGELHAGGTLGGGGSSASPLLAMRRRGLTFGDMYAPTHAIDICLQRMPTQSATLSEASAAAAPAVAAASANRSNHAEQRPAAPAPVGMGAIEVGLLSAWQRSRAAVHTTAPQPASAAAAAGSGGGSSLSPSLLAHALGAAALDSQQALLRRSLDAVAALWRSPRLVIHWDYCRAGHLAASVDVAIWCAPSAAGCPGGGGGRQRPCAAVSARLANGRLHAQLVSVTEHLLTTADGPMVAEDATSTMSASDASAAFPVAAVRAVGLAVDGVVAFAALVHAATGRLLLHRLRLLADSAGLEAHLSMMGTHLMLHRPTANRPGAPQGGSATSVGVPGEHAPHPPWMSVQLRPLPSTSAREPSDAPAPTARAEGRRSPRPRVVDVLLCVPGAIGGREARPRAVEMAVLPGRGELEQLERLIVRELLLRRA